MAFKRVTKVVSPDNPHRHYAYFAVYYEGQTNPEMCDAQKVESLSLQSKLQELGFTPEQLNLVEAYGDARYEEGYENCNENRDEADAGEDW